MMMYLLTSCIPSEMVVAEMAKDGFSAAEVVLILGLSAIMTFGAVVAFRGWPGR